jgi:archaellum component FlaC
MLTQEKEKSLIDTIKSLSEIEMSYLIENIVDHLQKEKMEHILDAYIDKDTIQDLQNEIEELENRIEKYKEVISDITDKCNSL